MIKYDYMIWRFIFITNLCNFSWNQENQIKCTLMLKSSKITNYRIRLPFARFHASQVRRAFRLAWAGRSGEGGAGVDSNRKTLSSSNFGLPRRYRRESARPWTLLRDALTTTFRSRPSCRFSFGKGFQRPSRMSLSVNCQSLFRWRILFHFVGPIVFIGWSLFFDWKNIFPTLGIVPGWLQLMLRLKHCSA